MTQGESVRRFTFDTGWAFLSLAVMVGIGIVVGILIGNFFNSSGLGAYTMVLTIWIIVSMTAGFGIPNTVIKFVAEYKEQKETRDTIVSTAIILGIAIGSIASVVVFLLSWTLEGMFNIPDLGHYLRIITPAFPLIIVSDIFAGTMNALRMMRHYALFDIFRKANVLVFTLVFVWIGLGVPGAVLALVMAPLSATIVMILYHRRLFTYTIKRFGEFSKKLLKFGSQLYMASGVEIINAQAVSIVIGAYLTDSDLGVYAVALQMFTLMTMIPNAIQRITYPTFSTQFAERRIEDIKNTMEIVTRLSFVIVCVVGLILIFYVDDIIRLIFPGKESYLAAVMPLRILAIMGVIYGILIPIGGTFVSANRPDIPLKISAVQAVSNIIIAVLLVPISLAFLNLDIGGVNGAAIAFGVSCIIGSILFLIFLKFTLKIDFKIGGFVAGFLAFLGILALAYFLTNLLGINGNLVGAILIPLFFCAIFYWSVMRKGGWEMILELLPFGFGRKRTQ